MERTSRKRSSFVKVFGNVVKYSLGCLIVSIETNTKEKTGK